ncbi:MAG: pimeloyl-[acyl-carrier protein] methyl ester esterase [Candidatus Kentron sp. G]|nr:MAG: pimeloyl-[acyl-carrier protein] methyl ester esterase [Candidatus Kentron sp. G]VFM98791.1 MAG: pimeloyl-[acyl-carrier protein] methyl ester esterase [Candidatus Kentron sp. G]VFN02870.1 MAG: pimeloyl-[acyl-carrier protein] methyl ester esterase [Candidatus Kentron sp. G]
MRSPSRRRGRDGPCPMSLDKTTATPFQHLLALHGWGFNSAVWEEMGGQLRDGGVGFSAVDLPGFGVRPMLAGEYTLARLADSVAGTMAESGPVPCVLMGWSLGGLVALEVAHRYPERVEALVMVAAAPRFTQAGDWPHGVVPSVLDSFSRTLAEDTKAALVRFLVLQAGRTESGRATVKKLRLLLFRDGVPGRAALEQGLVLLRETDSRPLLREIRCPVLFILGERDNLLSSGAAVDLRRLCPGCRVEVITGCAHAPFISHPTAFRRVLVAFLDSAGSAPPSR